VTILVCGATGTVGSEVVRALLPEHAGSVRALTRNADAHLPTGVARAVGDLATSDLTPILEGVDAVFLLSDGLDIAEHERRMAEACSRAGVRRIVKLSVLSAGYDADDPITSWHRRGEQHVRDSGVAWTFLRPTGFMSNALNWRAGIVAEGTVSAPFPEGRTAVVDPEDIGGVAARCLVEAGHAGAVYELTGPAALSVPEQVAVLGEALGRDLRYVEADPSAVVHQMTRYGMPAALAYAVVELLRSSQDPFNSVVCDDIPDVLGRPARTFADWATSHREAFLHAGGAW
jgi:uncharacterized protein YbjT (DUF2867 family)